MFSKVQVRQGALNYFRKLARQEAPYEIEAYMFGKVVSVDVVKITGLAYTKEYGRQERGAVCWFEEDLENLKNKVEKNGDTVLGSLHSHPAWDSVMSPADYRAIVTRQFPLCGICSVNKKRTRVRFWTPTSALPCEIIYT